MTDKIKLSDTGERMVPEFHKGILIYAEHVTRYQSAQVFAKDKIVLDIASGSGYGSKILAEVASHVHGVDISDEAVEYAKANFSANNLDYLQGSGEAIPLEDNSVDLVVTFETIEHIPDYKKFLSEIRRVLRPDGIALVSTPNDLEFAEGNHYHLHEFQYAELKKLLRKDFHYMDEYFQTTWKYVAITDEATMAKEGPITPATINLSPSSIDECLYFFFVCSNQPIKKQLQPFGALGQHYSDRVVAQEAATYHALRAEIARLNDVEKGLIQEISDIRQSRTYKLAQKFASLKRLGK